MMQTVLHHPYAHAVVGVVELSPRHELHAKALRRAEYYETPFDAYQNACEFENTYFYKHQLSPDEKADHAKVKEILWAWCWGDKK